MVVEVLLVILCQVSIKPLFQEMQKEEAYFAKYFTPVKVLVIDSYSLESMVLVLILSKVQVSIHFKILVNFEFVYFNHWFFVTMEVVAKFKFMIMIKQVSLARAIIEQSIAFPFIKTISVALIIVIILTIILKAIATQMVFQVKQNHHRPLQ